MLVEDALAIVAGEVCLKVHSVIAAATQSVRVVPGRVADGAHASWLARESKLFTLARHEGQTLVYSHDTETLYYARPELALTGECPDNHAFLIQVLLGCVHVRVGVLGFELGHAFFQMLQMRNLALDDRTIPGFSVILTHALHAINLE